MENVDTKEKKVVDIFPLGKGKRFLVYLSDLIISFGVAFLLFNVVTFPSAKAIVNYDGKTSEISSLGDKRDSVLEGYKLLFPTEGHEASSYFESNLSNTFTLFSSYYVIDASSNYDVLYTYYVGIKNDNASYISVMKSNDVKSGFFDFSSSRPVLKENYKEEFAAAFDSKDSLGSEAKTHYETFQNDFFLQCYYDLLKDVETNDLVYEGVSYKNCQTSIRSLTQKLDNSISISVYISEGISIIVLFLIVPLFNKNHRTLAMLFMKVERINASSLNLLRKRDVAIFFVYQLALNCALILFIPIPTVTINYVFNLGVLFPLSMISLGFGLISLFFVLFNSFNRSLSDILTGTILITSDSLDDIYRSKGYKV